MAPKKAAAAGPTAQDIELEWQKKEQQWQREEAQLAYFVKLQQEDTRVLRMRSRELSVDVESFASRTTFLENKSVELRIQAKKATKELSEQHAREVEALAAQDVLLEDLNTTVQTARTELVTLNTSFETVVTQNSDKVKAVAFRNSGIAGLREKVAKLRNERAHLISELEDTQRLIVNGYQDPRVAPFKTKPFHCILVAESTCGSWSFVENILMAQYQFDITRIDPAEIVFDAAWHKDRQQQLGVVDTTLSASSRFAAAAADHYHWSDSSIANDRHASLLKVLSYGEPQRTVLSKGTTGHGASSSQSPSTHIIRLLHDSLYAASREEHGEQSILVCISATLDKSSAADPLDAITFLCQGSVRNRRDIVDASDDKSSSTSSQSAIVSLRDVLSVVLGGGRNYCNNSQSENSSSHDDPSAVVCVEVTAPDMSERYIVVAGTHAEPTILHIPHHHHNHAPTTATNVVDEAANNSSSGVVVGGKSLASSSVLGIQLLQLLQDEIRHSGNAKSSDEFCQRLSMRLLCSDASVSRRPIPEWLQALCSQKRHHTDGSAQANDDSSVFLPKSLLCAPVSSEETQITLDFFAKDFLRSPRTSLAPSAVERSTKSGLQAAQLQLRHQQQQLLEEYCQQAFKAEETASLLAVSSCSFIVPAAATTLPEENSSAASSSLPQQLSPQPDLRQEVYYYFLSDDLSPQQLTSEVESVLVHTFRAAYGIALKSEEDRHVVFGHGDSLAGLRISCIAEGIVAPNAAAQTADHDGGNNASTGRWCILRFAAIENTAGPSTIASALSMPTTLRGSDLRETLAASVSSLRALPGEEGEERRSRGHPLLSIATIVETQLLADLSTHHVTAVPVIPVQCVMTTTQDFGSLCSHFETRTLNVNSLCKSASEGVVAIAPSLKPHPAPLTHLASAKFCDALHWRRVRHSAAAQQPIVLIVTARRNHNENENNAAVASAKVGWDRGPRDRTTAIPLLDAQHHELQVALALLHEAHSDSSSKTAAEEVERFLIPRRILGAAMSYHVSLSDLECTKEEREATLRLSAQEALAQDGEVVADVPSTTTKSNIHNQRKRQIWRNIMTLFPPSVAQFLTSVSYPCVVVSSPATIALAEQQTYHGLVVPRSLGTMRSRTQPDCLFRSHDIALALELYFQHILCTDATDARKGDAAASALSPSRYSKITGAAAADHRSNSHVTQHSLIQAAQQEDVADVFPSTWFPV
ncbi:Hypothetical protein, putative [Bodo saltans]|uniref:Uncharacterized protein n=1 Tax=Bodo saltans TaxID=75058 RepID=A0A0S4J1A1_BODSA|nr:Hypothetical protein, putative [Bodo saltans]|eukprot:CUG08137.1 Hypothetical protein, putative [Bodo saltans]